MELLIITVHISLGKRIASTRIINVSSSKLLPQIQVAILSNCLYSFNNNESCFNIEFVHTLQKDSHVSLIYHLKL